MKSFQGFIFILIAVLSVSAKNYTNYKLLQLIPETQLQVNKLRELEENSDFDFWSSVRSIGDSVDVMLSPEAFEKYKTLFANLKLKFIILNNNIQEIVDQEARELTESRLNGRVVNSYPRYADLVNWIDDIANSYSIVSKYSAGTSYQGRDIPVLQIRVGAPTQRIWFDCGIHAREWISPATCVNLIDKFLDDYSNGKPDILQLLNKYELHFMPILNPDGYEYTHTNDRYWRKNRRINSGSTCIGVDLNRNFPYQWLTGGSSTDPCSDTHAGPSAGSESETQAVINAVSSKTNWVAFLSLHSYGNWFLTPWGYSYNIPSHYTTQQAAGNLFKAAVKATTNEDFTVGTAANLLYIASGSSADWGYGARNIIHSYVIELRPKNGVSLQGFVLPLIQIPAVGDEIYAGVVAMMKNF